MFECPKCVSKWKVFPHGNAGCSGCAAILMLFILVPSGTLGFIGSEFGTGESTVIGLATLVMLIGGILLIVFGGHTVRSKNKAGGIPDDTGLG